MTKAGIEKIRNNKEKKKECQKLSKCLKAK